MRRRYYYNRPYLSLSEDFNMFDYDSNDEYLYFDKDNPTEFFDELDNVEAEAIKHGLLDLPNGAVLHHYVMPGGMMIDCYESFKGYPTYLHYMFPEHFDDLKNEYEMDLMNESFYSNRIPHVTLTEGITAWDGELDSGDTKIPAKSLEDLYVLYSKNLTATYTRKLQPGVYVGGASIITKRQLPRAIEAVAKNKALRNLYNDARENSKNPVSNRSVLKDIEYELEQIDNSRGKDLEIVPANHLFTFIKVTGVSKQAEKYIKKQNKQRDSIVNDNVIYVGGFVSEKSWDFESEIKHWKNIDFHGTPAKPGEFHVTTTTGCIYLGSPKDCQIPTLLIKKYEAKLFDEMTKQNKTRLDYTDATAKRLRDEEADQTNRRNSGDLFRFFISNNHLSGHFGKISQSHNWKLVDGGMVSKKGYDSKRMAELCLADFKQKGGFAYDGLDWDEFSDGIDPNNVEIVELNLHESYRHRYNYNPYRRYNYRSLDERLFKH